MASMGTIECCVCRHKKETRFFRILGATHGSFDFNDVCHACEDPLDHDVYSMDREDLMATIKTLRAAIRADRDATGHNLCWYRPELWGLLPEKVEPKPEVPPTTEFIEHCIHFRKSLDMKTGA
jgi:hypothetical protein